MRREFKLALDMLRGETPYIDDARKFAPLGNSIAGSLLSIVHGIPRQYAEQAVCQAVAHLDSEQAEVADAQATAEE